MGLHYTGELLAVTSETVKSRDGSFADFVSTSIVCIDGSSVDELRAGRDLPGLDLGALRDAPRGARVSLDVFTSKGRLYVTAVAKIDAPAKSA